MATKSAQQKRNRTDALQRPRRKPWLRIAGAVLLFGSWIVDNHLAKRWDAASEELFHYQLHVALHELALVDALAEANTVRLQSDQDLYRWHLGQAIRHLYQIRWGYRTLGEPSKAAEQSRQVAHKLAAVSRAVGEEDTAWLKATLADLQRTRDSESQEGQRVATRLIGILEGQNRARFWFTCLYVVGSLLVGVDFWKGYNRVGPGTWS